MKAFNTVFYKTGHAQSFCDYTVALVKHPAIFCLYNDPMI